MPIPTGKPQGLTPSQVNYSQAAQWKQVIRQALTDTRCATPAFLAEDMHPDTQTVTVQIAIQERVRTAKGAQWWDVPPIIRVPIVVPRGGGFSITLPLKQGDSGLLVFCDTCFDNWWQNGTTGAPAAANLPAGTEPSGSQTQFEVRRHYVHDCGFIPGMWSQKQLLPTYSTEALQIRSDDGQTVIEVANGSVSILAGQVSVYDGGGAALPLVNDNFYQWFITELMPFLRGAPHYLGPDPPANSETTVLKAE